MTRRERLQVDLPPEPMDELRALAEVSGCDLPTTLLHMIRAEVRSLYLDEAPPELAWRFERHRQALREARVEGECKRNGTQAEWASRNAEIRRLGEWGLGDRELAQRFRLSLRRIREIRQGDGL